MSYISNIKNNIDLTKISELEPKYRELAIAKMVCMEISKKYFRDETFFLFKENLIQREKIYNKELLKDDFSITCISICKLLKIILKENYNIDTELVTLSNDKYAHIDLMITCSDGKKYILNPLMDLIDFKVRRKTTYFATKYSADMYCKRIPEISFLTEEEIANIDNKINYLKKGKYFIDIKKYDKITEENVTEALEYILNNRLYINGIVDLKMFSSSQIRKAFNKEINVDDFYFYKNNDELNNLEFYDYGENQKKRGLLISYDSNIYIFPTRDNSYLKVPESEWNLLVNKHQIVVNKFIKLENLNELKQFNTDRNIIHNKVFLKVLREYEQLAKNDKKNILNFISYTSNSINIKYKCDLLFYIKNNDLIMVDREKNKVTKYKCEDEAKFKAISSKIYDYRYIDKEDDYLLKTDVLGIFELKPNSSSMVPYMTKIEDDNYLSRNYEQYYIFKDVNDLLSRRDKLINILLVENNLTQDEKYIVLENIINISAKIYYLSCINNIIEKDDEKYKKTQKNFINDITNFTNFINGINNDMFFTDFEKINYDFDCSGILSKKKQIELDNKMFVYNYVKSLNGLLDEIGIKEYSIITPGFGSLYIGPFMSAMYNIDFSNLLYSQYKKTGIDKIDEGSNILNLITSCGTLKNKTLVLLDDNIGTGTTMKKIKQELDKSENSVRLFGAYQYTFDRLQEFAIKSRGQELFNPLEIDLLTPINYPRHQIIETASIKLSISANDYIEYLRMFGYHSENSSDLERMILDCLYFYHRYRGISIDKDDDLSVTSKKLINKMISPKITKIRKEYL